MRITNSLFYTTSSYEQQKAMKSIYDINEQMSTKQKIQNSYEDSGVYVDTMRLNYEIATLEQSKETSSKAQTFAQNTDSTMNQFSSALEQFKTKLLQASNASNSSTSLGALADELEALKNHMVGLGNTSINGQFLFSGSSLLQKPLDAYGNYNGNSDSLTAVIGSGVELPYNIDGQSLFLGRDNDYHRTVSTNVSMYNQSKLNPSTMVEDNDNLTSEKIYLAETDSIRDLVGDTNTSSTDDPKAVFYLSGRTNDGTTFSNIIELNTSSKVSDLMESIGVAYGNSASNKVVDVSMNAHGQIEVKDLKQGNQLLEMNIFGAIDRNALSGESGDAKQIMNIDNLLLHPNVDIIAFNKSNFETSLSSPDLTMYATPTDTIGQFSLSFPTDTNTSTITTTTQLVGLFPSDVDHLDFGATSFAIAGKTVQDLMDAIDTEYFGGVPTATLNNNTIETPNSTIRIEPKNASNVLAHGDELPDAINYARRGFSKDGNELQGNISQIVKNTNQYATSSTKLVDVAGVESLNGKQLVLNYTDTNGIERTGTLNFDIANTTFSVDLDGDGNTTGTNETFSIYNAQGDPLNLNTTADKMTYQQLNDLISMATSGNLPKEGVSTAAQTAINSAIAFGVAGDTTNLAAQTAIAKTGISTETASYIQKAIDAGILRDNPTSTPEVVAKATIDYNNAIGNANLAEYNHYVSVAKNNVDVSLDYKGQLQIIDKNKSKSNIEFSMCDKSATDFTGIGSTALSFMANDSVTITNPSIDFFKDLDSMIEAVRSGNFRMDSKSDDPRNIGIQNSLNQIDHILDHVTKVQTKIGAYSNALTNANDRATYLSLNVQTVRSSVIDVDIAEAYLQFNQMSISYQAMLSTISKINSMTLLNYM
ncbi:MAG: flagellin [Sulfurospirillaceae bacterium]|nr:flagellin [Sulfurospirillaceae bacterium]